MVTGGGDDKGGGHHDQGHHKDGGKHLAMGSDGKKHPVPGKYHHELPGHADKHSWQAHRHGSPFWHPEPKDMPEPPIHFAHNPVDLELHLGDPRQRLAGMTDAERAWRKKYVQDEHLAPEEPVYVPEFFTNWNPFRKIYRIPWDTLERRVLVPAMGLTRGHITRVWVPKTIMTMFGICWVYYHWKYHTPSWLDPHKTTVMIVEQPFQHDKEIREKEPGLMEKAFRHHEVKQDYRGWDFKDRSVFLNLDRPLRP